MKRSLLSALAAAVLVLVGTGCKKSQGSESKTVRLQLNWVPEPEFGGFYAARDSGAYKKRGIDIEIVGGGASSPVLQMVATGQAAFGVAAGEDVVVARSRGADIVAIFATYQTSPQGIMVHGSRGLKSIEDLKEGSLALETGAAFGSFLRKKYGFSGVTLVPNDGGIAKFMNDKHHAQQVFVTSEPFEVKAKGVETTVFRAADLGFNPYANVVITRGALVRSDAALVRNFIDASAEGWAAYLRDPKPTNDTMRKLNAAMSEQAFSLAAEAQKSLIETDETKAKGLGAMTEERWSTLATQLHDLKLLGKPISGSECFSTIGFVR